ncbi:MAG TPA: glycoside hydrolase family 3 N-terminal domain-containing protein [Edaphocola sp.]|nr:glycoside hydrolase family 3 N-terminal domain-containing protein [Edaphocola sp.]
MKYFLLGAFLLSTIACKAQNSQQSKKTVKTEDSNLSGEHDSQINSKDLSIKYFSKNSELDFKVEAAYKKMNSQEKAAQMIMVASAEALGLKYYLKVKPQVSQKIAANILLLKGSKSEFIRQQKELSQNKIADLKPLFACDCEPTLLHNKFPGEPKMLSTSSLKTSEDVIASVDSINSLMDKMGIVINFAPILDIAANKAIINKRAFSNDAENIKKLSATFIKATQEDGKAATVKHFPGHGAVIGDTHKQSVSINGKMTELSTFESIIKNDHPILVMVGHIAVKNNPDGYNTEDGRPATTSKKLMTDLLRNKIGFRGIITTDAMNMQASKNFPNADWEAAKAGADLILMPLDANSLNKKIAAEIEKGSDLGKQFEASVKRIIRLKLLTQ